MNEYDFAESLAFSRGRAAATDIDTIRRLLVGCVRVEPTPTDVDLRGVDFVATLRGGATVGIDLKARKLGCSRHWSTPSVAGIEIPEPELSLESWSVCPTSTAYCDGSVGWTLDDSKTTDYTLHVFDPRDTREAFLLPFQLLRLAFRRNFAQWMHCFRVEQQQSRREGLTWQSECVFVPACYVLEAIKHEMRQ